MVGWSVGWKVTLLVFQKAVPMDNQWAAMKGADLVSQWVGLMAIGLAVWKVGLMGFVLAELSGSGSAALWGGFSVEGSVDCLVV